MREILFRGKCKRTDKWVFGYLSNSDVINTDKGRLKVHKETVSQFTGLKDKNGVKIFEGDLIHYDNTPYCVNGLKIDGKVVYYKGSWAIEYQATFTREFHLMRKLFSSEDFIGKKSKVIGNIHDNENRTN